MLASGHHSMCSITKDLRDVSHAVAEWVLLLNRKEWLGCSSGAEKLGCGVTRVVSARPEHVRHNERLVSSGADRFCC